MQASTKCVFKTGEEKFFGEVSNAPKLARFSGNLAYEGELQGEGVLSELKIYVKKDFAMVYGLERFKGKLGDKQGTFVFQRTGKWDGTKVEMRFQIIPGSATGQLKTLYGEANAVYAGDAKDFPLTLVYRFENEAAPAAQ